MLLLVVDVVLLCSFAFVPAVACVVQLFSVNTICCSIHLIPAVGHVV